MTTSRLPSRCSGIVKGEPCCLPSGHYGACFVAIRSIERTFQRLFGMGIR